MKIQQKKYSKTSGWEVVRNKEFNAEACNFVIVFGSTELLSDASVYDVIKTTYPNAVILINSTAGEIIDTQVNDETISLTAIELEKTTIKTAIVQIDDLKCSFNAGKELGAKLDAKDLKNVLVIADGQKVNGSELIMAWQESLPEEG